MIRVESDLSEAYNNIRVMKSLVMTKILSCAPLGLTALLRVDRENKSLRENRQVKMFAGAGYSFVMLLFFKSFDSVLYMLFLYFIFICMQNRNIFCSYFNVVFLFGFNCLFCIYV